LAEQITVRISMSQSRNGMKSWQAVEPVLRLALLSGLHANRIVR
jgi:hypothetical protein